MTTLTDAVRTELAGVPAIVALVGSDSVFTDGFIFQETLYRTVEGSGTSAIVVGQRGSWTPPNDHNTARFPRLQVEIYCDPDRDTETQPTLRSGPEKAEELFALVDALLHRPGDGGQLTWSGVRVMHPHRLDEPDLMDVPDGDGAVRYTAYYGLQLA